MVNFAAIGTSLIKDVAGSLLGGLFGGEEEAEYVGPSNEDYRRANRWRERDLRQDEKFRKRAHRNDMRYLVQGAQKAGFNPLTVLGATGGQSGFQSIGGSSPTGAVVQQPLSPGAAAARAAGEAVLNYDPIAEERARLENELLEQRLATAQQKDARLGAGVPSVQKTSSPTRQTPFLPNETNAFTINPLDTVFPVVDPSSSRIEDARITHGPYQGRYVMRNTEGKPFISPANFTPAAMREELGGGLSSEVFTTSELLGRGWTPAHVNERGELITKRPKLRLSDRTDRQNSGTVGSRNRRRPMFSIN